MEDGILKILSRVKQGDESAFTELSEKYRALTESAVHRFMPSFEADGGHGEYGLDDLRQYAAVALYRAAVSYEEHTDGDGRTVSFGLYAKICVNNALISVLRKQRSAVKKNGGARVRSGRDAAERRDFGGDPLERLIRTESTAEMRKKICGVLSEYEARIFDYYISGKRVREMAKELGRDEKSVSNAIYRVKAKIKGLQIDQ